MRMDVAHPLSGSDKLVRMAGLPFLAALAAKDRERLALLARTEYALKGDVLFRKGDEPKALLMVVEGIVKISALSVEGREITLNLIRPGDILGEIALFDGHPRTADALAMTDCEVLAIDRRDFIRFVQERPSVALKVIELLCARLRRTSEQVEDVAFRYTDGRLAKTLLRLHRDALGNGAEVIRITQREIANMAGMSRETINKRLRAWQRAHVLELGTGSLRVVDPVSLAHFAEADGA